MRHINFTEPNHPAWRDWRKRCQEARIVIIEAVKEGQDPKDVIDKRLYKEQKVSVYMSYDLAFRGKCAYCDRDIHNQYGDVEHYRPACGLTDADGNKVTRVVDGWTQVHPGYYWLAYDWQNLLPSCIRCNRPSTQFTGGRLIGKWDKFPVRDFRAWEPGEEKDEDPLLLHPVRDNPSEHLKFAKNGVLGWETDYGEATVKILGLNEYGLPDRRREKYEQVRSLTHDYIQTYRTDKNCDRAITLREQLNRVTLGYGDFTVYALMAINDERQAYEAAITSVLSIN